MPGELTTEQVELQRSRELLAAAWGDPALRAGLKKHVKEKFPDRHLPDDDFDVIAAPLKEENAKLSKKLDELLESMKKRDDAEAARVEERANLDFASKMEAARRAYNLTDEGFAAMQKRMVDEKSYDAMAAAAYIVSQTPPAPPPGALYGSNSMTFAGHGEPSDDARYKLLHSGIDGPAKYLEAEIRDAFGPNSKDYVAKEMGRTYADLAFAN